MKYCQYLLLMFAVAVAPLLVAEEAYKWVDEDGNVHYSDRKKKDAEEVILDKVPTVKTTPTSAPIIDKSTLPAAPTGENTALAYDRFDVTSPSRDEMFRNIAGILKVSLSLSPNLQPGHVVNVYLDGELRDDWPTDSLSGELTEVWRGTHEVFATISNAAGNELIASKPIEFHVQQNSVN